MSGEEKKNTKESSQNTRTQGNKVRFLFFPALQLQNKITTWGAKASSNESSFTNIAFTDDIY